MKIFVVPDVHQTEHWRKAKDAIGIVDKIIILGDYFDSHESDPYYPEGDEAAFNLLDIIAFKKQYPEKVDILVGNHDLHYIGENVPFCYPNQSNCYATYHNVFANNVALFDVCVEYDGWLFSHSGVSTMWLERMCDSYPDFKDKLMVVGSTKAINQWFHEGHYNDFAYYGSMADWRGDGSSSDQSPCWIRVANLLKSPAYSNYVIGHTQVMANSPLYIVEGKTDSDPGVRVVMCDSERKDLLFTLDTENLPEFKTLQENAKAQRKWMKDEQKRRSQCGEVAAEMRKKYDISKSVYRRFLVQANVEEPTDPYDTPAWDKLEDVLEKYVEAADVRH